MRGRVSLGVAFLFLVALTISMLPTSTAWSEPKPTAAPTVQNEVHVGQPGGTPAAKPSTAPSGAPATTSDLNGPPVKRLLKRNPFVPPTAGVTTAGGGPATPVQPTSTPQGGGKPKPTPKPTEAPPPAPSVTLAGIFSSGGFPTALLLVHGSDPVQVRVGDNVQGYRVTSINLNSRQVVLQMRNQAFRVSLPKDSPYGGGASGGGSSSGGSAPSAGTAPAPSAGGPGNGPLPAPPPAAPQGHAPGGGGKKGGR